MNGPKQSKTFGSFATSSREARTFICAWLLERRLGNYEQLVALCASELATNVVLHTRQPFTVRLQLTNTSVRLEVVDSMPDRVPVPVPSGGTAVDITELSETGRGLRIVSSLATRWGIDLDASIKTVWCEFDDPIGPTRPSRPVVVDLRPEHGQSPGTHKVILRGLPVRTAIASGLEVEDAIRNLSLVPQSATEVVSEKTTLLIALVERSCPVRLAGRHAAMDAAARNAERFDFDLEATDDDLLATGELSQALAGHDARPPSDEVAQFRTWLFEETVRQRRGEKPSVCLLPT